MKKTKLRLGESPILDQVPPEFSQLGGTWGVHTLAERAIKNREREI